MTIKCHILDSFRYLVKVNRDTQRCLERHSFDAQDDDSQVPLNSGKTRILAGYHLSID